VSFSRETGVHFISGSCDQINDIEGTEGIDIKTKGAQIRTKFSLNKPCYLRLLEAMVLEADDLVAERILARLFARLPSGQK
jgi:hypothetical protein